MSTSERWKQLRVSLPADEMARRLWDVIQLHRWARNAQGQQFCQHCLRLGWPCPTMLAAEGKGRTR